ncbi:EF hand [Pseudobythopirellula maris]|uniref:EF hand n=1 Tax=Pseudobythopirellula maris TaxID=2527991 RepID=A0A5C5ZL17_9BACT|nr:EF-hand domain-containing protein [Pseudobythopirellula maris]TWT88089.1 EF hand [Pseudobythopirellula maris]
MSTIRTVMMGLMGVAMASPVLAQPEEGPPSRGGMQRYQQMLERFDADGNGELSAEEFSAAQEARRAERQGDRQRGDRPRGDRQRGDRERGDRGPRRGPPRDFDGPRPNFEEGAAGEEGPPRRRRGDSDGPPRGGRLGAMDPEELFSRFDADGDDKISREEFTGLIEDFRERMQGMRRGGGRFGGGERGGRGRGPGGRGGPPPRGPEPGQDAPE